MSGLTLDAGALIAIDRNDRRTIARLRWALEEGLALAVPAGAVAEAWRDGRTQARLARFLASEDVEIVSLDHHGAKAAGQLCGATHTRDIVDASVVLCARSRQHVVLTSDEDDLRRLDPTLTLVLV